MKKLMMTAALLTAMAAQAHATDQLDDLLKNRARMVAAVAVLLTLPPKCALDHRTPSSAEIARFVVAYGHKDDDAFMAEVQVKMKEKEDDWAKGPAADKAEALEAICGWGVLMSMKVREANR